MVGRLVHLHVGRRRGRRLETVSVCSETDPDWLPFTPCTTYVPWAQYEPDPRPSAVSLLALDISYYPNPRITVSRAGVRVRGV